jgi:hypothetical protein
MRLILSSLLSIVAYSSNAQMSKFQIEPLLIFSDHFSKRTPIRNTTIGFVKGHHVISKRDFGLAVAYHYNKKYTLGIRSFNQEFEYGYRPKNNGAGAGLSVATGMTWSRYKKRIIQWNIEAFCQKEIKIYKRNRIYLNAGVQFGWLPYSFVYSDTNKIWPVIYNGDSLVYVGMNDSEREGFIPTKFIKYPAFQNNNLRIQLGIGIAWEHKINNRFGYGFNLNYRQGFNPLFIDGTEIFVDYFTNRKSQLFKTRITGTGIQFCNRFIVYLGKK